MKIRSKTNDLPFLFYVMISFFCMNFMGRGSIVCFIFSTIAIGIMSICLQLRIDKNAILIFMFSFLSFFSSLIYFGATEAIKCWNYVLMYAIGINGYRIVSDNKAFIKKSIFAVFAGYAVYIILTFYANINLPYVEGQRLIIDFWRHEYIAVTMIGLLSTVVVGYFFYALIACQRLLIKFIALVSVVIALAINIRTATRTPVVLFGIMTVLMFCIWVLEQRGIKALKTISVSMLFIIIFGCIYAFDVLHIRSNLESTPLFMRFSSVGTSTSRIKIMKLYFQYAFDFPWGGGHIEDIVGHPAHNYIQQCYDLYGILATIPLLFISFGFIGNLAKFIGAHGKNDIDYLFISMYISMLLQALMEPVYTGYPCYMFSLFLIHGIASSYLRAKIMRCDYESC